MDFDGVIVDSMGIKNLGFKHAYEREVSSKIAEVREYQRTHAGISRRPKFLHFERTVFGRPGDDETLDRLVSQYHDFVYESVVACPFIPGAQNFLKILAGRIGLHLVSGTPHDELVQIVERRHLGKHFLTVVGGPTTKRDAFAAVLANGNHPPETVAAIGDAMTECVAAAELGIPFIGVLPADGGNPFPPGTLVMRSLESLPQVLGLR